MSIVMNFSPFNIGKVRVVKFDRNAKEIGLVVSMSDFKDGITFGEPPSPTPAFLNFLGHHFNCSVKYLVNEDFIDSKELPCWNILVGVMIQPPFNTNEYNDSPFYP